MQYMNRYMCYEHENKLKCRRDAKEFVSKSHRRNIVWTPFDISLPNISFGPFICIILIY